MSEYVLAREIIERSEANTWDLALPEWTLEHITWSLGGSICLCGHSPIKELCHLMNTHNENKAIVGNCCVKKFLPELGTGRIFDALKEDRVNAACISLAYDRGVINSWENKFAGEMWRKRKYTPKQRVCFERIQHKIVDHFKGPHY